MQIPFRERAFSSEPRLIAVSPIKQISFCVRSFGVNSLLFCMLPFMYCRTCPTSHTKEYLGSVGLSLETPLRSDSTFGCLAAGRFSIGSCRLEIADLQLFVVLYAFFVSNRWARQFKMQFRDHRNGSTCC